MWLSPLDTITLIWRGRRSRRVRGRRAVALWRSRSSPALLMRHRLMQLFLKRRQDRQHKTSPDKPQEPPQPAAPQPPQHPQPPTARCNIIIHDDFDDICDDVGAFAILATLAVAWVWQALCRVGRWIMAAMCPPPPRRADRRSRRSAVIRRHVTAPAASMIAHDTERRFSWGEMTRGAAGITVHYLPDIPLYPAAAPPPALVPAPIIVYHPPIVDWVPLPKRESRRAAELAKRRREEADLLWAERGCWLCLACLAIFGRFLREGGGLIE
ncbi:unnamed protein product [Vitrella brassicaformis CCMP3155]|uniref:Uncharacterized protein n=1 Tax=Vitrella brassicaformis (strain CCMP3155) TaxID=1169540 RepID=A0A0G4GM07_VITBC|nr:unnamed protein product [Vitrella brassicaformis CCMP3155]|eukprot:CEM31095.1 unnamed protein product [Vitrella brassicaformis CCMP3155]